MWQIKRILDFTFKKNILIVSFALLLGVSFYTIIDSLFRQILIPIVSNFFLEKQLSDLYISYSQTPDIRISLGAFIQSLICFLIIIFFASLFYFFFKRRQTRIKKEIDSQVMPTFRDGVNLEIRDYLKYIPQIKDILKSKKS
jgi:large-conductance mechanosensitive channel